MKKLLTIFLAFLFGFNFLNAIEINSDSVIIKIGTYDSDFLTISDGVKYTNQKENEYINKITFLIKEGEYTEDWVFFKNINNINLIGENNVLLNVKQFLSFSYVNNIKFDNIKIIGKSECQSMLDFNFVKKIHINNCEFSSINKLQTLISLSFNCESIHVYGSKFNFGKLALSLNDIKFADIVNNEFNYQGYRFIDCYSYSYNSFNDKQSIFINILENKFEMTLITTEEDFIIDGIIKIDELNTNIQKNDFFIYNNNIFYTYSSTLFNIRGNLAHILNINVIENNFNLEYLNFGVIEHFDDVIFDKNYISIIGNGTSREFTLKKSESVYFTNNQIKIENGSALVFEYNEILNILYNTIIFINNKNIPLLFRYNNDGQISRNIIQNYNNWILFDVAYSDIKWYNNIFYNKFNRIGTINGININTVKDLNLRIENSNNIYKNFETYFSFKPNSIFIDEFLVEMILDNSINTDDSKIIIKELEKIDFFGNRRVGKYYIGSQQGESYTNVLENINTQTILSDPYPSPTNGNCYININIPKSEYTQITIYNLHTNTKYKVFNDFLSEGNHKIYLNIEDLKLINGIYFIQLQTNTINETRKLIYYK